MNKWFSIAGKFVPQAAPGLAANRLQTRLFWQEKARPQGRAFFYQFALVGSRGRGYLRWLRHHQPGDFTGLWRSKLEG
jgi:hypothetical protein